MSRHAVLAVPPPEASIRPPAIPTAYRALDATAALFNGLRPPGRQIAVAQAQPRAGNPRGQPGEEDLSGFRKLTWEEVLRLNQTGELTSGPYFQRGKDWYAKPTHSVSPWGDVMEIDWQAMLARHPDMPLRSPIRPGPGGYTVADIQGMTRDQRLWILFGHPDPEVRAFWWVFARDLFADDLRSMGAQLHSHLFWVGLAENVIVMAILGGIYGPLIWNYPILRNGPLPGYTGSNHPLIYPVVGTVGRGAVEVVCFLIFAAGAVAWWAGPRLWPYLLELLRHPPHFEYDHHDDHHGQPGAALPPRQGPAVAGLPMTAYELAPVRLIPRLPGVGLRGWLLDPPW